jgi:hypothetical protein
VLSIRTRLSGQQKVKERERAKEMQALIDGTLDDFDKKNKKRTRGIQNKLRGMDFVGEGADVIIEGNDRTKRKKEWHWERDLRQGKYAQALDSVLEEKENSKRFDSVTVSTTFDKFDYLHIDIEIGPNTPHDPPLSERNAGSLPRTR